MASYAGVTGQHHQIALSVFLRTLNPIVMRMTLRFALFANGVPSPKRLRCHKAQSAMEYLMTYGWAILVIAVVLGVLYSLGIFSPSNFAPKATPGSCQVFRPNGPNTNYDINLEGTCGGELPQYDAQFNGGSAYISLSSPASSKSYTQLSISAWVTNPGNASRYEIMNFYGFYLNVQSGKICFFVSNVNSGYLCSSSTLRPGYNFIAATLSNSTETVYVNGESSGIASYGLGIGTGSPDGTIGVCSYCGNIYYFNGQISNIQVYNTSLTNSSIKALYYEGIGGAPAMLQNIVSWWPLNGNANDYSGNNNNGVPTNVVYTGSWQTEYTPT